ncbi:MAG: hypothetical protein V1818_03780 [Candidatus Aenigmatarchaeota archaeon]
MKSITEHFLLFIVGIFVIVIVMTTIFGKGIAYNYLSYLSTIEPRGLQENIRNVLTVASYSPGEFEARIPINVKHSITITDNPKTIVILPESESQLAQTNPQPFMSQCDMVKRCTKVCKMIGDKCAGREDCCGLLSCNTRGRCESTFGMCGNQILEDGEECEPADPEGEPPFDGIDNNCESQCSEDCSCPDELKTTQPCTNSNQCFHQMECLTFVKFYDVGEVMIIRKYFEGDQCKITIE